MIQPQTCLKVSDNTGARKIMCIRVLSGSRAKNGGEIIRAVKNSFPNITIKRSDIVRAVVVRTRRERKRIDGSRISFYENSAVIVNKDGNPRGSRVFGPISQEIRYNNFSKIISMATELI